MIICPKCKSANVSVNRECSNINTFGSHKRIHRDTSIIFTADHNTSSTYVSYRTTALCKNCGYTWTVGGSGAGVSVWSLLGVCFIIIAISFGLLYFSLHNLFGGYGKSANQTSQTNIQAQKISNGMQIQEESYQEILKITEVKLQSD